MMWSFYSVMDAIYTDIYKFESILILLYTST
jgi:hypothetical protein